MFKSGDVNKGIKSLISSIDLFRHLKFSNNSISSSSNLFLIILIGFHATIVYGSISFETTLLAQIIAQSQI
nr:hypothetical protein [bacterium]